MLIDEIKKDAEFFAEPTELDFDSGEVNEFAKKVLELINEVSK